MSVLIGFATSRIYGQTRVFFEPEDQDSCDELYMNLFYSAISIIALISVFLNFYKQNSILLFPVIWLQVIRHTFRLFDFENSFMQKGDMDWLFLIAVNFVVCIF